MARTLKVKMNMTNSTQNIPAQPSQQSSGSGNEYFYILIVMSFYGIFLIGIMLGYVKSKRKEPKSSLLLLYQDEERLWGEAMKPLPVVPGRRVAQVPMMLSMLQDSVVPPWSCAICLMEGGSVSSESSSPDVHLTIQEEVPDDEMGETSETPLNESSEGSSDNIHHAS
ncbi:potassium voltage-gated channel subfamily E member 4 isoform X1 [Ornithorhynchus anatinus]|uniref:Potassium voltage-gated channel subfamily E regulatory subunit 4 n=1 Tax=Ornithorhynchus anatinus TaxID=9258 RepID=A0A6I8PIE0_ORNAN|nr:potassium voltage-gated channel subfamily E member 4 isoform X1 [Ornithorhynchus anatinus]